VDRLVSGREALGGGAWAEARAHFEAAVADEESPEALEGLGVAAWWPYDRGSGARWSHLVPLGGSEPLEPLLEELASLVE
jgi:hypothetical protein